ncbi:hypothetical protein [Vibrio splendidus]|uniref:hypothetical protein n=1 Tax=Vibrio splendidus TaxID=29497 RepID=UPI000C84BF6F|nr:hypothetical protein [Vibrio splendidus]PMI54197.1 hypothetical protein BCU42_18795 [Vibrio splendidus]
MTTLIQDKENPVVIEAGIAQRKERVNKVKVYLGISLIFLLSAFVVGVSSKMLLANFYVLDAEKQLGAFLENKESQSTKSQPVFDFAKLESAMEKVAGWDTNNPDSLLLLAAYQAVIASQVHELGAENDPYSVEYKFEDAIATAKQAQLLRPMNAKAFVAEAEYQWRNGASFEQVNAPFEIALQNGHFERPVALFGLEFYLAYWTRLNVEQRVLVSSYLLEPKKYRINHWQINKIIARSPEKLRACRLLAFNDKATRACKGT